MKIGYYDRNSPSALMPFVAAAREKRIALENIEDLSGVENNEFDVFVINPVSTFQEYWDEIGQCISSNPNTRFLLFIPVRSEQEYAEGVLGNQRNIEYLNMGKESIKKLYELVNHPY